MLQHDMQKILTHFLCFECHFNYLFLTRGEDNTTKWKRSDSTTKQHYPKKRRRNAAPWGAFPSPLHSSLPSVWVMLFAPSSPLFFGVVLWVLPPSSSVGSPASLPNPFGVVLLSLPPLLEWWAKWDSKWE